ENTLVFIDFYTSWCGPCKMMMKDVFPQKLVGDYLNERFVCIKLDAEKEGKELTKRYQVKAYPTFVGVDPDGKEVMRKVGMAQANDFIGEIDRQIDPEKSPARLKQRYESGERTPDLIAAYAGLKISEARAGRQRDEEKEKEAFELVGDYFKGLKKAERLAPENLFIYTDYTDSPLDEMAQYMITHRDEFAAQLKPQITKRIAQLFQREVADYLTCGDHCKAENWPVVWKQIGELGLNRDSGYTAASKMIESHAKGDMNAYLAVCEKEYANLTRDQQSVLITRFSSVIATQDEAVRKRASQFMRHLFVDMDANLILWAAMELSKIEGGNSH
ncbi:MAG: thioredoxin family protein, partial [Odoribacter splanchnicus]